MNPIKLLGIILIVAGALGLVYGGFSYPSESTALKLGTMELKVQATKDGMVPMRQYGFRKPAEGVTTLDEVMTVTAASE